MPIDGDIWLKDPLDSSYPPSIAFKAAQFQDEEKALVFLRKIKEMVFMEKKNITRWENLELAAKQSGLDIDQFKADFQGKAQDNFQEDLLLKTQLGVRGFPSIFFLDEDGNRFLVYGSKGYEKYEEALLKLYPDAKKKAYDPAPESLFEKYSTLTTREFIELSGKSTEESKDLLNELVEQNRLRKQESKNGPLWIKKQQEND